MNEYELVDNCRISLNTAEASLNNNNHESYCRAMSDLLDRLMVELVGGASNETQTKIDNVKP